MPLQPHSQQHRRQSRRISTCHRHPTSSPITGFCASCLRERLAGIEDNCPTSTSSPSTSHPRRSKSCSCGPIPSSSSAASEPRRKSCDVRTHNTLNDLFAIDDDKIKPLDFNPPTKVEAVQVFEEEGELKTMKEFIDLELGGSSSSSKETSGKSIWEAASVFSKRLKEWRKKQGKKKEKNVGSVLDKTNKRETKSEIGEYGLFGRRSCDTDPRLSVDDSRFSFDEPRASWDGCLMKQKAKDRSGSNAEVSLGPGAAGLFHGAKLLVTEKELRDSNWYSNVESGSKGVEFVHSGVGQKGFNLKKGNGWRNVLSIWGLIPRPKQSEFREEEEKTVGGYAGDGRLAESFQNFRRMANVDEDRGIRGNVSEVKLAESLPKLKGLANGDEGKVVGANAADHVTLAESLLKLRKVANGNSTGSVVVSQKLMRNCSVSARNSVDGSSCYGTSMPESNSKGEGEKRRDSFMMQQNRTVGYSPNNLDNGLLRFYLTPLRSCRRSKSEKSKLRNSNFVGGSVL